MMERIGPDVELRSVSHRLERVLKIIEPVFLEAGGNLAATVDHLGQLTNGLGAMAGRLEADDTASAIVVLRDISTHLGGLSGSTQASEDRLQAMNDRAAALGNRIARLRKVIGEVKVLAVNAKVEAAHVTARDIDFSVFTQEIGRLAAMAGDGLNLLAEELAGLLDTMVSARAGLTSFMRDHGQSLASVSTRLGHGLAAIAKRSGDSAQAIRALADLSRHMAGEVAQAVEGLQVGDITRQRGEHVQEALATLLEVLDSPAIPADHRDILAASVCRLQSAQASEAGGDLQRETARIRANLVGLADDIADLPGRCASVYASSADARVSFLQELGHELQEAHQLLGRYAHARASVDKVVADIATVVAGMFRHIDAIRSIEADMRVMGLNATFKCARLGKDGLALSVIAQELRSYSNRTAEDGVAITNDLRGLIDAATQMDETERRGEAAEAMEANMAAAVRCLDVVGDYLSHQLAALSTGCSAATGALGRTVALLDAHPEFAIGLAECANSLVAHAGVLPADGGALESIREEVLELLRGRYTMASERKVHGLFGGAVAEDAAPPAEAEDFLF
jgi:methyl-accepting chemotaxis protein